MNAHTIRILLVENNAVAAKLLAIQLSEYGYISHIAPHGKAALELLEKNTYSLIISDLHMPIMNGITFISIVRKNPLYTNVPIVVMSSDEHEDTAVTLLEAGADDYIAKPVQMRIFLSKIQSLLAKHIAKNKVISQQLAQHLSLTQAVVIVCMNTPDNDFAKALLCSVSSEVIVVASAQEFQLQIAEHDDVCIIVDSEVTWLLHEIECMQNFKIAGKIPLLYVYESNAQSPYDTLCNVFPVPRQTDFQEMCRIVNFVLQMLESQKAKSLSLLKQAVMHSSFVFEREFEYKTSAFTVSILHENCNDMPGGDFYEVVTFNERYSFVFLGDIMGKSWGAWFYVPAYLAYIRSTIKFISARNIKELAAAPHKILNLLNSYFAKDLQLSNVFTTLTLAVIDNEEQRIILSNAGGIYPLFYSNQTKMITDVRISGILMGIDGTSEYSKLELSCEVGDAVCMYTDGYVESTNEQTSKLIGIQGVKEVFAECISSNLSKASEFDEEYMNHFSIQKNEDDRTSIIIRCGNNL
ncbi:MAG: fused response regulator/phosphatase [Bacteroidales bacterium]|nr:fused response regulator/phosphatase [Bacteroidales bacterium]